MRIREESASYTKRAANLSVNADLLDQAKSLDINLSATLERALEKEVRIRKRELWLSDNREAIAAYNEHVRENGVWSDSVRKF
ncbi:MAG: type II toxin-antitoxin system CcdA family antitoxin [Thermomonas sp.]